MNKLEEIKEKIRTINPNITDELLDLLYEFAITKYTNNMTNCFNNNPDLDDILKYVINPTKMKKKD